jgi:peroxiredoxin
MSRSKTIARVVVAIVVLTIIAGVVFIAVRVTTGGKLGDCSQLNIVVAEGDTLRFEEHLKNSDRVLVTFYQTTCAYCNVEMKNLQQTHIPDLTVDVITTSSREDVDKLLGRMTFDGLKAFNIVYDDGGQWHKTMSVAAFPTSYYFEHGEFKWKKVGFFDIGETLGAAQQDSVATEQTEIR